MCVCNIVTSCMCRVVCCIVQYLPPPVDLQDGGYNYYDMKQLQQKTVVCILIIVR